MLVSEQSHRRTRTDSVAACRGGGGSTVQRNGGGGEHSTEEGGGGGRKVSKYPTKQALRGNCDKRIARRRIESIAEKQYHL